MDKVKRIHEDFHLGICVKLSKDLFGFAKDLVMIFVYIPPEGATVYSKLEDKNDIVILEKLVSNIHEAHECYIGICGDLNARTSVPRNSCDTQKNGFGLSLIELCNDLNVHIVNGRVDGDLHGEFTCVT